MIAEELTAIVEGAYAMALDPSLTADWTLRTARGFGAALGTIGVCTAAGRPLRQSIFYDRPQLIERYFADGIDRLDPQMAVIGRCDRLSLYTDSDYRDEQHADTARFLSYVRSNSGVDRHMTAIVPLSAGNTKTVLSLSRAVADGPTPTIERERMAAILKPLGTAFQLGFDHADKLDRSFWDGIAATMSEPALLLDDRGAVIRSTPGAEALLARLDALDIVGRRLRSGDPAADARLQRAIAAITRGSPGVAGGVRLPCRSGGAPLIVSLYPLVRSHRPLAPYEAAVLVTLIDPATTPAVASSRHAQAFALTPRESQLAAALFAGHSIESAAASLSMALTTARLHLRRLLAKTGTSRQIDLIRLLTRV